MTAGLIVMLALAAAVVYALFHTAAIVPQQTAWVIERLGRYDRTLLGGFHLLVPFIDSVRNRVDLMECAANIPEQDCITRDNVLVHVDGVLYFKVVDPERAIYGIKDYRFAIEQLAQTTLRSEIGKIELDHTFEERPRINSNIVAEIDKASEAWGVKVLRYEIKRIKPSDDVLDAMEKQMRAEREKRAQILQSEGTRAAAINQSEGMRESLTNQAEGHKQQLIREADGKAAAIRAVAQATAEGIAAVAQALRAPGGIEAVQYRVASEYIAQFGNLAKEGTSLILPANLGDIAGLIATAMSVVKQTQQPNQQPPATPAPDKLPPGDDPTGRQ